MARVSSWARLCNTQVGWQYSLLEVEGKCWTWYGREVSDVIQTFNYVNVETERSVQLVVLRVSPVPYILGTFWASHLMNFATWEGMYCVFPESTLQRKEMRVFSCSTVSELKAYDKYVRRGFKRMELCASDVLGEFQGHRFVGDGMTRRVGFSKAREGSEQEFMGELFSVGEQGVKAILTENGIGGTDVL